MAQQSSRYQILERTGAGGSGEVFKAIDTRLNRVVALKVLREDLRNQPEFRQRFQSEAQAAGAVSHPNLIEIFGVEEIDGSMVLVLEYLEGESLKDLLHAKGHLAPAYAAAIVRQAAQGLSALHDAGVVHRDIKPSNIHIVKNRVILTDFGIATGAGQNSLTKIGTVLGTLAYMAPEQIRGEKVLRASDIFSLGTVFYEALTGVQPFAAEVPSDSLRKINSETPNPPDAINAEVPQWMSTIVMKCLEKEVDERYSSASELLADLARAAGQATSPATEPRKLWLDVEVGKASAPAGSVPKNVPVPNEGATREFLPYGSYPLPATKVFADEGTALAWLLALNGPERGRQFRLGPTNSVGRSSDCEIVLSDPAISRSHARIVRTNGLFRIVDSGSPNGVFVNGATVQEQELRDRDELRLGNTILIFVQVAAEQDVTPDARRRLREFETAWNDLQQSASND